jgi:hypothetical protein
MIFTGKHMMKSIWPLVIAAGMGIGLSGCVESQPRLSDEFGVAIRQDLVAQIANPDARYPRTPPASNGPRAALAQGRYQTGTSIEPSGSASKIGLDQGAPQAPAAPQGPAAEAGPGGP